jgi:sec-independent protein translocase protein TatB
MFPEDRMMEVLLIGALALIVIGPKDLPIAMRKFGQFVGKMRGMAAEFRASFDELARQSELDELRKEVEALRVGRDSLTSALNPLAETPPSPMVLERSARPGDARLGPPMTPLPEPPSAAEVASPAAEAPAPTEDLAPAPIQTTTEAPPPKAARKPSGDGGRPKAGAKPANKAAGLTT